MEKFSIKRLLIYLLGMFVMALGISLSIRSGLGITPMSSFPYVLSLITGTGMSQCMVVAFSLYVLLQFIILRKGFKASYLLQILVALVLGIFTDITGALVQGISFDSLPANILLSIAGAAVLSLGLTMYIAMDLPALPPEGLASALNFKIEGSKFKNCKTAVDLMSVVLATCLSLLFLGRLEGVGIGTVIAAVLVGQLMPLVRNISQPLINWALEE